MSELIKKHPAISLFVVALTFGTPLTLALAAGLLPPEASQLGALRTLCA